MPENDYASSYEEDHPYPCEHCGGTGYPDGVRGCAVCRGTGERVDRSRR
jgi:DnaJ-class molecular chaperone